MFPRFAGLRPTGPFDSGQRGTCLENCQGPFAAMRHSHRWTGLLLPGQQNLSPQVPPTTRCSVQHRGEQSQLHLDTPESAFSLHSLRISFWASPQCTWHFKTASVRARAIPLAPRPQGPFPPHVPTFPFCFHVSDQAPPLPSQRWVCHILDFAVAHHHQCAKPPLVYFTTIPLYSSAMSIPLTKTPDRVPSLVHYGLKHTCVFLKNTQCSFSWIYY